MDVEISKILSDFNKLKWSVAYKGILAGVAAGLLVSFYRLGMEFGIKKSLQAYAFLKLHPGYIIPWVLIIAAVGYVLYYLMRLEPYAKGSGIPQVEGIVMLGMKMKWHTILLVRFLAGFLSSFFGLSLGREGPSIQIGAAGSHGLAKKISGNILEENCLITAGASAGLSAAFNAPLSGAMFALEEVHRTFSPNILLAAITAALTADVVSKCFFGLTPVLDYGDIVQLPIWSYAWLLPLGVLCGVVGAITNKGLLKFGILYEKLPPALRPMVALLIALPCGLLIPQVLGGGQNLILLSEKAQAGISMLVMLLAVKLLFTCTSFGSGIPGGIFMPILSIGALTGSIVGQTLVSYGLPQACIPACCVCAMAGVMSGSVKAPITSILLMAEMTGSLIHLLPVAAVAFIALLTSDLLKISPIYEVLLERLSGESEESLHIKESGTMIEISVELGSKVDGKKVKEVNWPEGVLIVGLSRGKKEVVPNGDTQIMHGDYLVALSSQQEFEQMHRALMDLCHMG